MFLTIPFSIVHVGIIVFIVIFLLICTNRIGKFFREGWAKAIKELDDEKK